MVVLIKALNQSEAWGGLADIVSDEPLQKAFVAHLGATKLEDLRQDLGGLTLHQFGARDHFRRDAPGLMLLVFRLALSRPQRDGRDMS
jgi:hypothetical protein